MLRTKRNDGRNGSSRARGDIFSVGFDMTESAHRNDGAFKALVRHDDIAPAAEHEIGHGIGL